LYAPTKAQEVRAQRVKLTQDRIKAKNAKNQGVKWGGGKAKEASVKIAPSEATPKVRSKAKASREWRAPPKAYQSGEAQKKKPGGSKHRLDQDIRQTQESAKEGNMEAQFALAEYYRVGLGVEKSIEKSMRFCRMAASKGHGEAQQNLGLAYARGDGVRQNHQEAVKYFSKAAAQGKAISQMMLAMAYWNGNGVDASEQEALRWLHKSADEGHDLNASYHLGTLYLGSGEGQSSQSTVARNEADAELYLAAAARRGHTEALCRLGTAYIHGEISSSQLSWTPDGDEFVDVFGQARGVDDDKFSLTEPDKEDDDDGGVRCSADVGMAGLLRRRRVKEEDTKAASEDPATDARNRVLGGLRLLRAAAAEGNVDAQMELGVVYRDGTFGVPTDIERSFQCFCAASGQGDPQAMINLGALYMSGNLPTDETSVAVSPTSRQESDSPGGGGGGNREQMIRAEHDQRGVMCFLRAAAMGVREGVYNLKQLVQDPDDRQLLVTMAKQFFKVESDEEIHGRLGELGVYG
jgi:TPR repeat protein